MYVQWIDTPEYEYGNKKRLEAVPKSRKINVRASTRHCYSCLEEIENGNETGSVKTYNIQQSKDDLRTLDKFHWVERCSCFSGAECSCLHVGYSQNFSAELVLLISMLAAGVLLHSLWGERQCLSKWPNSRFELGQETAPIVVTTVRRVRLAWAGTDETDGLERLKDSIAFFVSHIHTHILFYWEKSFPFFCVCVHQQSNTIETLARFGKQMQW